MVELEVAFAAFGVILAGLCPMIVAQLRHVEKLESRFSAYVSPAKPGLTYYVIPRPDPWARKLSGTATITPEAPGPGGAAPAGPTANAVSVLSMAATPTGEAATAVVRVRAIPAPPP